LDISKIKGTGEAGRILEKDVEQAIKKPQVEQTQKAEVKQAVKTEVTSTLSNLATVTMNGYEKGMQKSMTESNTIPHLYLHEELDITEV
jgi:2-oxoisovalerate dehydrogenase E2 component (dihydrolipoyl transacylase)